MVSWITQDGQRVDNDVLELIKISRSEVGEYRCEASNECGNATETASIDVQCKDFSTECTIGMVEGNVK